MPLTLLFSPVFLEHAPPSGHPERPERADVFRAVAERWSRRDARLVEPSPAAVDDLVRVHDRRYVELVLGASGRSMTLDPDTYVSPGSVDAALAAAGASCEAVDLAVAGGGPSVALVRPPGHHAERGRAMGFCLLNNAAVAAARARHRGLDRVAVIDFDVHHGNGTQWMFYDDPSVLYLSVHQYPFYPGTGAALEAGDGRGAGFTVNAPLEAGATDADYDLVFRSLFVPVLEQFRPDLLVVSAGFDAHQRDPLGGMHVSTEGFLGMMSHLWSAAVRLASGRLAVVTEGGYDLTALGDGIEVTLDVLAVSPAEPAPVQGDTTRARRALAIASGVHRRYWPAL